MKWFRIEHPAVQCQVGPIRWLKFKLSERLGRLARALELDAINPDWRNDDIPF